VQEIVKHSRATSCRLRRTTIAGRTSGLKREIRVAKIESSPVQTFLALLMSLVQIFEKELYPETKAITKP